MLYFVATKPFKRSTMRYFCAKNTYGASRFLSFCNKDDAKRFKEYVVYYRHKYNKWPVVDGSVTKEMYECVQNQPIDRNKIEKHVLVVGWDGENVAQACMSNGVSLIETQSFYFDETTNTMKLKARDIPVDHVDFGTLRCTFERLVDTGAPRC